MESRRRLSVLFALVVAAAQVAPGAHPEPSLADALAKSNAQDFRGAAELLEKITVREPRNAAAWRALGAARQKSGDPERAIAAWSQVLELEPSAPLALYAIGACHAAKHAPEAAFEFLTKAKATRRLDMTQIEFDPDLAPLRSDPRFRALLPAPSDFEKPFVEPTTILREFDGEAANDQFGWIARMLGDVDDDSTFDFVTSAPTHGGNAGRVYVYSGGTGRLLWSADGRPGDALGTGVERAGDVDDDGIPDVIASAPGGSYAKVWSGRDGALLLTLKAEGAADDFGRHVSGAGDWNRDGHEDVLVGAPANGAGGRGAGRAYLFSGADGEKLLTLTGERAGDAFGSAVAGFADDDHRLLVIGAPKGGARATGRVYGYGALATTPTFTFDSDETGAALGAMFVAICGTFDDDDMPDVFASDWQNGAKGPSTGRVYVRSGVDGHPLLTLTGEAAGDGFGTSRSTIDDVDGDEFGDLLIGAWQQSSAAIAGGRVYLHSGRNGALIRTITDRIPGDTLGFDAVGLDDVDGDGTEDLLVSAAWSGVKGFHSGRVFILSGRPEAAAAPAVHAK